MYNAFLIIRTVFFALLIYFHFLIFILTSWNIAAAGSAGVSAPGPSVFLLVSSILIFVLVPIAYLAEQICTKARLAHVGIECAWTVLMSVLQLAANIDVTVNGPPMYCQTHFQWAMCASFSLLVPVSWLAALVILSYCLTICLTAATHATSLPDIWITPVSHVPWFHPNAEMEAPVSTSLPSCKHIKSISTWSSSTEESCTVPKYIAGQREKLSCIERCPEASVSIIYTKGHQSIDATRPAWARHQRTRRGIDAPFGKPLPRRKEPPVVLDPPPKTYSRPVVMSSEPCSMEISEREETTSTYSRLTLTTQVNPDLPIPRPALSEWVRAGAAHTTPFPS